MAWAYFEIYYTSNVSTEISIERGGILLCRVNLQERSGLFMASYWGLWVYWVYCFHSVFGSLSCCKFFRFNIPELQGPVNDYQRLAGDDVQGGFFRWKSRITARLKQLKKKVLRTFYYLNFLSTWILLLKSMSEKLIQKWSLWSKEVIYIYIQILFH